MRSLIQSPRPPLKPAKVTYGVLRPATASPLCCMASTLADHGCDVNKAIWPIFSDDPPPKRKNWNPLAARQCHGRTEQPGYSLKRDDRTYHLSCEVLTKKEANLSVACKFFYQVATWLGLEACTVSLNPRNRCRSLHN